MGWLARARESFARIAADLRGDEELRRFLYDLWDDAVNTASMTAAISDVRPDEVRPAGGSERRGPEDPVTASTYPVPRDDPTTEGGTAMSRVRVHNFSISLDGFGTGEGQSLDAPFGHAGERLHAW